MIASSYSPILIKQNIDRISVVLVVAYTKLLKWSKQVIDELTLPGIISYKEY